MRNLDTIIDSLLTEISDNPNYLLPQATNIESTNKNSLILEALQELRQADLIKIAANGIGVRLSAKGFEMHNSGGWLIHKENEAKRLQRNAEKEIYDHSISRFQSKTKYYPFIVSTLALLVSIAALIYTMNKPNDSKLKIDQKKVNRNILPGSSTENIKKFGDK